MTKKQTLKIVAFFMSIVVLIAFSASFLNFNKKQECVRMYGYYAEPENSLDVALIGSSEFYRGYIAPLAYDECGFTSYALSLAAMPASLYLPIFKEVSKEQNPKMYVVEINGVFYDNQQEDSRLREWFDNVPLSSEKIEDIKNVVPEEDRSSYYFSFEKYHNNWYDIKTGLDVFSQKRIIDSEGYSYMKGFYAWFVKSPEKKLKMKSRPMSEQGEEYMIKFLDYCKDNNVENIIFVRWPHRNKYEVKENYETVTKLIESYGYSFINFGDCSDEIGIDPKNDYADDEHLNPIGAEKMTRYFARYMNDNYDVVGEHSEKLTKEWDDCADKAKKIMEICIEKTDANEGGICWRESSYKSLLKKWEKENAKKK